LRKWADELTRIHDRIQELPTAKGGRPVDERAQYLAFCVVTRLIGFGLHPSTGAASSCGRCLKVVFAAAGLNVAEIRYALTRVVRHPIWGAGEAAKKAGGLPADVCRAILAAAMVPPRARQRRGSKTPL
jgi:hypothetical protein